MNTFRLDGRVILVTGAAGHLGAAIARECARAGAAVVLAGRTAVTLQPLADRIVASGGQARVQVLDVADPQSRRQAMAQLAADVGLLHGLVNNAYAGRVGPLEQIAPADFAQAAQYNLVGPFDLIQAALPLLEKSGAAVAGGASIVNVASMYGSVSPDPSIYEDNTNNPVHYGATKAGLMQMTRYLAVHLAQRHVRVNSIAPGPFPSAAGQAANPAFATRLAAKVPMGRLGVPDEVAAPVVFLLSGAASYVTGANLAIDGGWTAW